MIRVCETGREGERERVRERGFKKIHCFISDFSRAEGETRISH